MKRTVSQQAKNRSKVCKEHKEIIGAEEWGSALVTPLDQMMEKRPEASVSQPVCNIPCGLLR